MMLRSGLLCVALSALAGAITCPDGGACGDGTACCRTGPGYRYGCCPLERSLPMVRASAGNDGNDTVCGDGSHCPSEYSCLKSHKRYHCCPLPQGVSCSDGKHCCPEHHRCGEDGHTCIEAKDLVGAVMCPDGDSECPEGTTCCQLPDGGWGCCPFVKAVCCEDRKHCCPEGAACDLLRSKCHSATRGDTPMWAKLPARRRAAWEDQMVGNVPPLTHRPNKEGNVSCDSSHACPDGNTCCKNEGGDWACCPLPEAVCCDDHTHCCPKGTTCDGAGSCNQAMLSVPWLEKVPPLTHRPNKEGDVSCDSSYACPDGSTCCKNEGGDWACCPLPEAVCCDDHTHCCPKGTTCDEAGSCNQAMLSVPWLEKVPPLTHRPNKEGNVSCDSSHACPDGSTCCKNEGGDWACCPLPEAVCCDDHTHCCPKGTTCDEAGSCNQAMLSVPWLEKVPPLTHRPNKEGNVSCDSSHACPDGSTCCKNEGGDWACCPLPEAVCCDDHTHCCPKGTTCDGAGSCNQAMLSVPWLEKVPPLTHRPNKEGNVSCDSSHACPDGSTCCKNEGGDWACCPLPEAVCCDDHTHCCPKGTTCDGAGSCNQAMLSVPWLEKVPPLTHRPNKEGDVSCDSSYACPDGSTCCKNEGGDWACCPLPEAVCCDDHTHCCPKGTTCDEAGSCNQAMLSVPWLEKVPPLTHRPNKEGNVSCDSSHACPDGSTCCKNEGGDWACCPLPEAVCCDDHTHCCPKGTTCDGAGSCNQAMLSVPWLEKVPPLTHRPNKEGNVSCDSSHACPDGSTCCKNEGGDWACCPLPEAVCCDDHTHCCPKGTTCDGAGSCNQAMLSVPWLEKVPPLTHRPNKEGNVSCDSSHSCPDGSTCCKNEGGDWACCPLPEAVCCDDHIHCCRKGTTCNLAASSCDDAMRSVPWLEKVPPLTHRPNKERNVSCDSSHACPDGSTCCKNEGGDWACCPLSEALCCGDGTHCCPSGYTCGPTAGSCSRSGQPRWDTREALFGRRL